MAKKISLMTNGNTNLPVANAGLKLSKIIDIEKIEEHEKFKSLYSIDDNLLERITENIKQNKFDNSQPIHIWIVKDDDKTEHFYLIDGYTRVKAAKQAGLITIPYFEHYFENFEDAYRYVLHLQIDRRNLSGQEFMQNLRILMGSDYVKNYEGDKAELIAKELNVSKRTVQRGLSVENNATEEQKAKIDSGNATPNQIYNENHPKQKKNKKDDDFSEEKSQRIDEKDEYDDDISDSLSDNSGTPQGINITDHSDGIERPNFSAESETDTDRWIKEKNIQVESAKKEGFEEGLKKGSDLAYEIYEYILCEIENGKSADDLRNDEKFSDFSAWKIYKAFGLENDNDNAKHN